ncbi:hypothetical protein WDZ92_36260 [Nostoc sp. NIES-2111]|jgi:hypothetical protein
MQQTKHTSSRKMHKYVWMLVGVFSLMAVSYPVAMFRVSQKEKFHGFHVKSLTIEGKLYAESVK